MRRSGKILLTLGCLLMILSVGLLVLMQEQARRAERDNARIVQTMQSILTDRKEGTADPLRHTPMPALALQGEDYIALLEIPACGLQLPVGNEWDQKTLMSHPCRFWGTAYDGTLIIGGFDQAGQFDCFDRIEIGTAVTLTDMTGCRYCYVVDRVERSDSAEQSVLTDPDAELTLFVRDAQLLQYIILRCVQRLRKKSPGS